MSKNLNKNLLHSLQCSEFYFIYFIFILFYFYFYLFILFYQINWHEYYKIIIKPNSSILTNFIITHICTHTQISVWYKQIARAWESRDLNFKFTFSHSNSLYALWSTVPLQSFRSRKEALGLHEFLTIRASSITSLCVHDLLRWGFVELR